jgi:hypothetical protein
MICSFLGFVRAAPAGATITNLFGLLYSSQKAQFFLWRGEAARQKRLQSQKDTKY